MESEYTEAANQFLDCVNKLNVHTLLYKKREKKNPQRVGCLQDAIL